MDTMEDTLALLCKVHNEKILDEIKRTYPGIDRILTPEKITAYDRGEYDDLDADQLRHDEFALPVCVLIQDIQRIKGRITYVGGFRLLRQYEAELISRYKAGLL